MPACKYCKEPLVVLTLDAGELRLCSYCDMVLAMPSLGKTE